MLSGKYLRRHICSGYLSVYINREGQPGCMRLVHRLVAMAWIINPRNKPEVNHIDGNKLNNSVGNLEWVTHSENRTHAYRTGLQVGPHRKLTDDQVREIRRLGTTGMYQRDIAKLFNCTQANVWQIIQRNYYRGVSDV